MKLENVVWVVTAIVSWPQDVKTGVAFSDHKVVVTPSRISIHGYKHYFNRVVGVSVYKLCSILVHHSPVNEI